MCYRDSGHVFLTNARGSPRMGGMILEGYDHES